MDLQSLGNLGEFIGGIVVVISLFYLAFQVRQNTQSLDTESYARTLERVAGVQSKLAENGELSGILVRATSDPDALARDERVRLSWLLYEMFGSFEFMFYQAQKGVLETEIWERWQATMAWWLSFPGVETWWRSKPTPFGPRFTAVIEAELASPTVDREAAERFRGFLRGEAPPDRVIGWP